MKKTPIKAFSGRIIGWYIDDERGKITLRDFYGRIKGTYDSKADVTRDFYGRIVSRGNTLAMLLDK